MAHRKSGMSVSQFIQIKLPWVSLHPVFRTQHAPFLYGVIDMLPSISPVIQITVSTAAHIAPAPLSSINLQHHSNQLDYIQHNMY